MAHQRIRKFNTAHMYPGKGMDNDLCMAVRAGNRVFLRGQTGFDLDGNMVGIGDPSAQAEMAMQCVQTVIGRWLKGVHPCSTGLIVQGLARPEMVMEIDVEAIIPEADA